MATSMPKARRNDTHTIIGELALTLPKSFHVMSADELEESFGKAYASMWGAPSGTPQAKHISQEPPSR